jgi:hypothetical protein
VVVFFLRFVERPNRKEIAATRITAKCGNAEQTPEQREITDDGVARDSFDLHGSTNAAVCGQRVGVRNDAGAEARATS